MFKNTNNNKKSRNKFFSHYFNTKKNVSQKQKNNENGHNVI